MNFNTSLADDGRHRTDKHAGVIGCLQQESRDAQTSLQIKAKVQSPRQRHWSRTVRSVHHFGGCNFN
jgi:hypothetical protein